MVAVVTTTGFLVLVTSLVGARSFNQLGGVGCISDKAQIGMPYTCLVSQNNEWTFRYKYSPKNMTDKAIRVDVASQTSNSTYPVLIVIKQQLGILSWQLPMLLESTIYQYKTVSRTLCPVRNYPGGESISSEQNVVVDVSTASKEAVNVEFTLKYEKDYFLSLNTGHDVSVSPSEPSYYEMKFPDDMDMLVVSVMSDDDYCAIVSIQPIGCPVFDLDKNVQFTGIYQTMTRKAGVTLRKKDFDSKRFYVVIVVKPNDYDCSGYGVITKSNNLSTMPRIKNLTIVVEPKITERNYLIATMGAIVVFILFYVFSITISIVHCIKYRRRDGEDVVMPPMEIDQCLRTSDELLANGNETSYGTVSPSRQRSSRQNQRRRKHVANHASGSATDSGDDEDEEIDDSSLDEDDIDMLHDVDSDKNILRTKTFLYVADLAQKNCKVLSKKSKLYLWNMITIAIFYSLPVVQLVITYETVLHVTGNQDICYYNFLCTYPLGTISDFNHVYSNVGYILLGFLFIGLVWRRDLIHKQRMAMNDQYEKHYGIPRHFGLFYAMGLALMMEGIMSGCYHVCPNYSNFQFDTSFMYMIACLCMLKIYQTRHPDINANAYAAFVGFAVIIGIGVLGVLYGTPLFWIIFATVHILSCVALSAQIYYMGRWKLNFGVFKRIYLSMKTDLMSERHCFRPMYLDRMILLLLVNLVNWTFSVYGLITRPTNFASYLLAIFIVNLLMYVAFYIIMKLRSKEKILPVAFIYITLSVITWAAGLYFFLQKSTTWELTPAQSRLYNKPCLILNFYDDHDIWHFLSAASMFFSFNILLTLDDDLVFTPRDRIPVF